MKPSSPQILDSLCSLSEARERLPPLNELLGLIQGCIHGIDSIHFPNKFVIVFMATVESLRSPQHGLYSLPMWQASYTALERLLLSGPSQQSLNTAIQKWAPFVILERFYILISEGGSASPEISSIINIHSRLMLLLAQYVRPSVSVQTQLVTQMASFFVPIRRIFKSPACNLLYSDPNMLELLKTSERLLAGLLAQSSALHPWDSFIRARDLGQYHFLVDMLHETFSFTHPFMHETVAKAFKEQEDIRLSVSLIRPKRDLKSFVASYIVPADLRSVCSKWDSTIEWYDSNLKKHFKSDWPDDLIFLTLKELLVHRAYRALAVLFPLWINSIQDHKEAELRSALFVFCISILLYNEEIPRDHIDPILEKILEARPYSHGSVFSSEILYSLVTEICNEIFGQKKENPILMARLYHMDPSFWTVPRLLELPDDCGHEDHILSVAIIDKNISAILQQDIKSKSLCKALSSSPALVRSNLAIQWLSKMEASWSPESLWIDFFMRFCRAYNGPYEPLSHILTRATRIIKHMPHVPFTWILALSRSLFLPHLPRSFRVEFILPTCVKYKDLQDDKSQLLDILLRLLPDSVSILEEWRHVVSDNRLWSLWIYSCNSIWSSLSKKLKKFLLQKIIWNAILTLDWDIPFFLSIQSEDFHGFFLSQLSSLSITDLGPLFKKLPLEYISSELWSLVTESKDLDLCLDILSHLCSIPVKNRFSGILTSQLVDWITQACLQNASCTKIPGLSRLLTEMNVIDLVTDAFLKIEESMPWESWTILFQCHAISPDTKYFNLRLVIKGLEWIETAASSKYGLDFVIAFIGLCQSKRHMINEVLWNGIRTSIQQVLFLLVSADNYEDSSTLAICGSIKLLRDGEKYNQEQRMILEKKKYSASMEWVDSWMDINPEFAISCIASLEGSFFELRLFALASALKKIGKNAEKETLAILTDLLWQQSLVPAIDGLVDIVKFICFWIIKFSKKSRDAPLTFAVLACIHSHGPIGFPEEAGSCLTDMLRYALDTRTPAIWSRYLDVSILIMEAIKKSKANIFPKMLRRWCDAWVHISKQSDLEIFLARQSGYVIAWALRVLIKEKTEGLMEFIQRLGVLSLTQESTADWIYLQIQDPAEKALFRHHMDLIIEKRKGAEDKKAALIYSK